MTFDNSSKNKMRHSLVPTIYRNSHGSYLASPKNKILLLLLKNRKVIFGSFHGKQKKFPTDTTSSVQNASVFVVWKVEFEF